MLNTEGVFEVNALTEDAPSAARLAAKLLRVEHQRDAALAERDEARSIAILMRRWAGTPATKALVDRNLELDQVPHWLIDDSKDQT